MRDFSDGYCYEWIEKVGQSPKIARWVSGSTLMGLGVNLALTEK